MSRPIANHREPFVYRQLRKQFPPPPHLLESEVRPWLLDTLQRYLKDNPDGIGRDRYLRYWVLPFIERKWGAQNAIGTKKQSL
jgi:hypothetical protein